MTLGKPLVRFWLAGWAGDGRSGPPHGRFRDAGRASIQRVFSARAILNHPTKVIVVLEAGAALESQPVSAASSIFAPHW